jgi:hypothetical protein
MSDTSVPILLGSWVRDDPPDLSTDPDAFGALDIAKGVASLLERATAPYTVSLSGSWGVGKTTVAKAAFGLLPSGAARCTVDVWADDLTELRKTLAVEAGAALAVAGGGRTLDDERRAIAERIDGAVRVARTTVDPPVTTLSLARLRQAFRRHRARSIAVSLFALLIVLLVPILGTNPVLAPVGNLLAVLLGGSLTFLLLRSGALIQVRTSSATQSPAQEAVEVRSAFISAVGGGQNMPPVFVLIDNLDRLAAADALTVMRDIRSMLDVQGSRCIFVVPVDRKALADAVAAHPDDRAAALDYLEKFFNVDSLLRPLLALRHELQNVS